MSRRPTRPPTVSAIADRKAFALNLGPTELIIVLLIFVVLFGAARLPKLARSLGESAQEFKSAQAAIGRADDPIE